MTYVNGTVVTNTYDALDRIVAVSYNGVENYRLTYDGNGNISTCTEAASGRKYSYEYDSIGRLIRYFVDVNGTTVLVYQTRYNANGLLTGHDYLYGTEEAKSATYTYDEHDRVVSYSYDGTTVTYTYDSFERVSKKTTVSGGNTFTEEYTYWTSGNATSTLVSAVTYKRNGTTISTASYTYDAIGNITKIVDGTTTREYTYDTLGQLLSETVYETSTRVGTKAVFTYDLSGNILSKTTYSYNNGSLENGSTKNYTYGNTNWGDLLTAYDSRSFTFDDSDTLISDGIWTYTWQKGRELASMTRVDGNTEVTVSFTYDADGIRTGKTVVTKVYETVQHTVTFVANGTTVGTLTVDDGYYLTDADYPAVPAQTGYEGTWNRYTSRVTSDVTIQATYTRNTFVVTFVAGDTVVQTITVARGYTLTDADYPAVPEIEGYSGQWIRYTAPVVQDITISATYAIRYFTVTFVAGEEVVNIITVPYGYVLTDADYPAIPELEGHTACWIPHPAPIVQDTTVYASYDLIYLTVTFEADGEEVDSLVVPYGYVLEDSDYPAVPIVVGYEGEWERYDEEITEDIVITASYHETDIHTVTFHITYPSSSSGMDTNALTPIRWETRTISVPHGYVLQDEDYPTMPTVSGYNGAWVRYRNPVMEDITVEGHYSQGTGIEPPPIGGGEIMSTGTTIQSVGSSTDDYTPTRRLVSTTTQEYTYLYIGGSLRRMKLDTTVEVNGSRSTTTDTLYFSYDVNGVPLTLTQNGTKYTFVTNLQGDVVGLVNSAGTRVVSYTYDAWGNLLTTTGDMASTLGEINPIRYRGYCYDTESSYYYLQSRYYNPEVGRFINADNAANLGAEGEINSHNLFAYCLNDPVNRTDANGNWSLPNWAKVAIGTGAIAVGVIATVATGGAAAPVLAASLKIALTSAAIGAISGAGISAASHRISTGSWEGAEKAAITGAIDGACDGFMWGGITAGATFTTVAAKGIKIQEIGKLKPSNKPGDGYPGVKYQAPKANGKYTTKSIELHSPHGGGPHDVWHWQQNTWNTLNNSISSSAKRWTIWGKPL